MKHLLLAPLFAVLAAASFAAGAAPANRGGPGTEVRVADTMVQPVKARKRTHTRVTRTRVHKRTVTKHTHTQSQSSAAATDTK